MTKSPNALKATRSQCAKRRPTREKILDSAEELFSRYGVHDVMLKDITDHVGVDAALFHYYFKDKNDLFDAVISTRVSVTSARRMAALAAYEQEVGDHPTLEGVLHAYLAIGPEEFRSYGVLCAQMSKIPDSRTDLIEMQFEPVVLRLIDLLSRAMPECPRADIVWGYHFLAGALMLTLARGDLVERLSGDKRDARDMAAAKERLVRFVAGGFRQFCQSRGAAVVPARTAEAG